MGNNAYCCLKSWSWGKSFVTQPLIAGTQWLCKWKSEGVSWKLSHLTFPESHQLHHHKTLERLKLSTLMFILTFTYFSPITLTCGLLSPLKQSLLKLPVISIVTKSNQHFSDFRWYNSSFWHSVFSHFLSIFFAGHLSHWSYTPTSVPPLCHLQVHLCMQFSH